MTVLPVPSVTPLVPAPTRAAQFIVEIVGQRTVPASQASDLLRPDWQAALGQPEVWGMRPADTQWQPLGTPTTQGSFDSLTLAWDLIGHSGSLSPTSAQHLLKTAEQFAHHIGRRAIPLTVPTDIPREIKRITSARRSLDTGLNILELSAQPRRVTEIGPILQAAGLVPEEGEWRWKAQGHPEPLFAAIPFEVPQTDGFALGYHLPRCPDPLVALEGVFRLVDYLRNAQFHPYDEDRYPLTPNKREVLRQGCRAATSALASAGLAPGSWPALKVFPADA